jgi:hypothetical protein
MDPQVTAAIITGVSYIAAAALAILVQIEWTKGRLRRVAIITFILVIGTASTFFVAQRLNVSIAGKYKCPGFDSVIWGTGFGKAETYGCGQAFVEPIEDVTELRRVGLSSTWLCERNGSSIQVMSNRNLRWTHPGGTVTYWTNSINVH